MRRRDFLSGLSLLPLLSVPQIYSRERLPDDNLIFIFRELKESHKNLIRRYQLENYHCLRITDFMDEMIQAIIAQDIQSFRKKYAEIDQLLFTDIHLLKNRPGTTNEFVQTILARERKVVMTSLYSWEETLNMTESRDFKSLIYQVRVV